MEPRKKYIKTPYDKGLIDSLARVFKRKTCPGVVIETGTYEGMGTTEMVRQAISQTDQETPVFTIEAHRENFRKAKDNLDIYENISVVYGFSVGKEEALNFIGSDLILKEHDRFPEVHIDGGQDPSGYYKFEINSFFADAPDIKENLLEELIDVHRESLPLFILDSCGGIGYLEFTKIEKLMEGFKCFFSSIIRTT
jgi:hypothetical protein